MQYAGGRGLDTAQGGPELTALGEMAEKLFRKLTTASQEGAVHYARECASLLPRLQPYLPKADLYRPGVEPLPGLLLLAVNRCGEAH